MSTSKTRRQSVDCRPDGRLRQAKWPTGLRPSLPRGHAVEAVRRRWPHRSGHRGHLNATRPSARLFASPRASGFVSPRRTKQAAAPPLPLLLRRRRAREPPQKRDCHLALNSAVASSSSTTSLLCRRTRYWSQWPFFRRHRHERTSPELCSSWPTATGALPSSFLPPLSFPTSPRSSHRAYPRHTWPDFAGAPPCAIAEPPYAMAGVPRGRLRLG